MGLGHGSTLTAEYGDQTEMMGYGGGYTGFSAPQRVKLGMRDASPAVAGRITIAPLHLAPETTDLQQVMTLEKSAASGFYYLSYRRKFGFDAAILDTYTEGLTIHECTSAIYANSFYLKTLQDGESFVTPEGYNITQVSHNSEGVQIVVNANRCISRNPTVEVTQAIINAIPGQLIESFITIKNNDWSLCGPKNFLLTGTFFDDIRVQGDQGGKPVHTAINFTPSNVILNPSESRTTSFAIPTKIISVGSIPFYIFAKYEASTDQYGTSGGTLNFGTELVHPPPQMETIFVETMSIKLVKESQ